MTYKDWEKLFELIEQVTNMPGTWQEKRSRVLEEAQNASAETALEEFAGWFQSDE